MLRWGFRLQLAGLIGSLLFILAILAAYAYVGLYYLEGQGPSAHRRELARVATQLSDRWARKAGPWLTGRGAERFPFPVPPRPPADIRMPRFALAGLYRVADQQLIALWRAVPRGPLPPGSGPGGPPPVPPDLNPNLNRNLNRNRPPLTLPPPPGGPPPGRLPPWIPPREREALLRLCEQAVRQQRSASEFRSGPRDGFWFYAQPVRVDGETAGAIWCLERLSEEGIFNLSVWALPATIAAALLGMSLALWTAVNLQRSIMTMQAGLELGREMVASLMPASTLEIEGYEVARRLEPAIEVGGDFYNLFPVDGGAVGIVLGDISGAGVPAALYMAVVTTLLEEYARAGLPPAAVMAEVSQRLERRRPRFAHARRMFATAVYGRLDLRQHRLALCSAGQTPCIRLPAGGKAEYVKLPGTPLGRMGSTAYQEQTLTIEPGDTLVFATDGFVEMRNGKAPLGYDGWLRLVEQQRDRSPQEMLERLFAATAPSSRLRRERDDRTLLILKRNTEYPLRSS
jgi:serine phosphatase RsbU (regulator of sigma subunit)